MRKTLTAILSVWLLINTTKSTSLWTLPVNDIEKDIQNDYEESCNNQNTHLNISNAGLKSIGSNFLSSPIVTCLLLQNNENSDLSSSAFDKLPNLRFLDLSNNKWSSQQLLHAGGHPKLKTLIMNNVFVESSWYSHKMLINSKFPMLEKLYLRNNELVELKGSNESNLSKLTHLYLSNNYIKEIAFSPNDVISTTETSFAWLPKSLKHLDLDNNQLESISFINVSNLQFLSIKNNKLITVDFKELPELKYLSLDGNGIKSFNINTLYNIPKLEYLSLSKNEIAHFDGRILDYLLLLQNLNLDSNALTIVPEVQLVSNLKNYSLRFNQIAQLTTRSFNNLLQLQVLHLDNNQIVEIETETFNKNKNLEVLSLGKNSLTNFPTGWMGNLQNLRTLCLEGNMFTNLEVLELSGSPTSLTVFFQNNPIKYIRYAFLKSAPENVILDLNSSNVTTNEC